MEYQKIINLLDNIQNELSTFRTRNWVEINDESPKTYSKNNQIKFKSSITKSNLCDYKDAYILVSRTVVITRSGDDATKRADERNKGVIFN